MKIKKVLVSILLLALVFTCCGCGSGINSAQKKYNAKDFSGAKDILITLDETPERKELLRKCNIALVAQAIAEKNLKNSTVYKNIIEDVSYVFLERVDEKTLAVGYFAGNDVGSNSFTMFLTGSDNVEFEAEQEFDFMLLGQFVYNRRTADGVIDSTASSYKIQSFNHFHSSDTSLSEEGYMMDNCNKMLRTCTSELNSLLNMLDIDITAKDLLK